MKNPLFFEDALLCKSKEGPSTSKWTFNEAMDDESRGRGVGWWSKKEPELKSRRSKRARIEMPFDPDFLTYLLEYDSNILTCLLKNEPYFLTCL